MRRKNFHYTQRACTKLLQEMKNIFTRFAPTFRFDFTEIVQRFTEIPMKRKKEIFKQVPNSLGVSEEIPFPSLSLVRVCVCECLRFKMRRRRRIFHSRVVSQINKSIISLHARPTRNFMKRAQKRETSRSVCVHDVEQSKVKINEFSPEEEGDAFAAAWAAPPPNTQDENFISAFRSFRSMSEIVESITFISAPFVSNKIYHELSSL